MRPMGLPPHPALSPQQSSSSLFTKNSSTKAGLTSFQHLSGHSSTCTPYLASAMAQAAGQIVRRHMRMWTPPSTPSFLKFGGSIGLAQQARRRVDIYTVHIRVPDEAVKELVSNNPPGVYCDPRTEDIRQPHPAYTVIWLPKLDHTAAEFKCRTCTHSLSLVRNKARYGVRVRKADEAKAWALLRPDTNFVDIQVQRIFEIGPIPHGTQKRQIETILKDWGWAGKVLQPGRGTPHSMTWYIGATDEPPMRVMQAFKQDVLINQIKQTDLGTPPPKVYTATRTQKHLRSTASNTSDPWLNATQDPWANYKSTAAPSASSGTDTKKHYHQLQEAIQKDIAAVVRQELAEQQSSEDATMSSTQTGRLEQLESTLQELSSQNKALKGWLHETQTKLGQHDMQMTQLKADLQHTNDHMQSQFNSMKCEISANFDN